MPTRTTLVAAAMSLALATAGAQARSAQYQSQDRSLRTNVSAFGLPSSTMTDATSAIGLYDEDLSDSLFDENSGESASAEARQLSVLGPRSIPFVLFADANASFKSSASANSMLRATFVLDEITDFRFGAIASMVIDGSGNLSLTALLEDAGGGDLFSFTRADLDPFSNETVLPEVAGTLMPGEYTFTLALRAESFEGASDRVQLTGFLDIPAPGAPLLLTLGVASAVGRRRG